MNYEEIKQLVQFQSRVSSKEQKMRQTHLTLVCLNYVEENPKDVSDVGCFWVDENRFFINSSIFGKFISRKPNTINRNFRTHGFQMNKTTVEMRKNVPSNFNFDNIPDSKNWIERYCDGFSKKTTEEEAYNWEYKGCSPKKHIIPPKMNKRKISVVSCTKKIQSEPLAPNNEGFSAYSEKPSSSNITYNSTQPINEFLDISVQKNDELFLFDNDCLLGNLVDDFPLNDENEEEQQMPNESNIFNETDFSSHENGQNDSYVQNCSDNNEQFSFFDNLETQIVDDENPMFDNYHEFFNDFNFLSNCFDDNKQSL